MWNNEIATEMESQKNGQLGTNEIRFMFWFSPGRDVDTIIYMVQRVA